MIFLSLKQILKKLVKSQKCTEQSIKVFSNIANIIKGLNGPGILDKLE